MGKSGLFVVFFSVLSLGACSSRRLASTESGTPLRQWLELPPLIEAELGNSRVFVTGTLGGRVGVDRALPAPSGKGGSAVHPTGSFLIRRPKGTTDAEVREALADEVLDVILDRRFPRASRRATLFRFPNDPLREKPLEGRIRAYGRAALTGEKRPYDPAAQRWWQLRLRDQVNAPRPREASVVLAVVRVFGYRDKKYVNIDAGHAALGVITLDDNPNDDVLLNPGSKSRDGYEAELPFFSKAGILNEVRTANFWDWAETQTVQRHLNMQIKFFALDPEQTRELERMADDGNGIEFGEARALTNNCANGAVDILNSLLPLHRELPRRLNPVVTPREVLAGAPKAFLEIGEIEITGTRMPEGESKTPAINIEELSSSGRRQATSFARYAEWLDKYLR
jgi:hypothetical protein